MGVKGLWRLLDGTGQPVSLESLEGKILAIDISLWLNMAVKGMRDVHGHSANDAHLITLFNRICKLLYFGVKPVFVFDGKAPLIKRRTLQERKDRKHAYVEEKQVASQKLLQNYLKKQVLQMAIKKTGKGTSNSDDDAKPNHSEETTIMELKKSKKNEEEDLFVLPTSSNEQQLLNSSDDEREEQWMKRSSTRDAVYGSAMMGDFRQMMSIDVDSHDFKALPPDIQHELLHDIKEIRKRRRTQFETMPDNSKSFSDYQLAGLLAKREISDRIEKMEKRMQENNAVSMTELGFADEIHETVTVKASQLLSDENTRFILINKLAKKKVNPTVTTVEEAPSTEDTSSLNETFDSLPSKSSESILEVDSDTDKNEKEESDSTSSKKDVNAIAAPKIDSLLSSASDADDVLSGEHNRTIVDHPHHSEAGIIVQDPTFPRENDLDSSKSVLLQTSSILSQTVGSYAKQSKALKSEAPVFVPSPEVKDDQKNTLEVASPIRADLNEEIAQPLMQKEVVEKVQSEDDDDEKDFVDVEDDVSVANVHVTQDVKEKETSTEQSDISSSEPNPWQGFENEDANLIQEQIDTEDIALIEKMKASARAARDLTDVATTESQQLLQLFGIPYLVSPQEAESQCAYLETCGLTMGTITDDSDVLLFGGRLVYKAVFDRKHDPAAYSASDIKAELGLERNHLINIALCSGSDYTIGIENVGPVAALEIMKEFPGDGIESLVKFKTWWDEAHKQVKIPKVESKIKSRLRKLTIPDDFPSQLVVDAYLHPVVNESKESFSWGIPDLDAIRNFLMERLHWTKSKVDESLLPVLKKISDRNNRKQMLISNFFSKSSLASQPLVRNRKKKSQRVKRAIFGIAQVEEPEEAAKTKQTSRKRTKKAATKSAPKRASIKSEAKLCLSESSSSDAS